MRASYPTYKSTSIPWMPEMPKHWEQRKNKYLFRRSKSLVGKDFEKYPVLSLTMNGVIRRDLDNPMGKMPATFADYQLIQDNTLLFCLFDYDVTPRTVGMVNEKGIVSPAYTSMYPIEKIDLKYYYYWFLMLDERKMLLTHVTNLRNSVSYETFAGLFSPFPPLPEQTAIANYLDAKSEQINRFIAKKEKLIALLKEQKQAVINELLEDKEGKWERRKLKFLAKVFFSNVDKHSIEEEIPVLLCNYTDVYKNEFIRSSFDFMQATATIAEIKKFAVKKGDVLVTKDSETADDIANPAFVVEQIDNLVCGYHLAQIRTGSQLLGEFLFRVLQSKTYNKHFEVRANGVTRVGLSISAFTDFMVPLPSINEQENIIFKIRTEYNRIDNAINRIEKEIEKVKELKQSLIAEVVTGRIKVA